MATTLTVSLPFGIGSIEWTRERVQQRAAWALYVELVTRVALQMESATSGLPREALTSLHSLFPTTRQILRDAGPRVGCAEESVGGIALAVLNRGLRPFLSKWHPVLSDWERFAEDSDGSAWERDSEFREELRALQPELEEYANALRTIAESQPWFRRLIRWLRRTVMRGEHV